ncbi:MAG TPA: exodeoxyribonuclease V subunit alpha [Candidatus Binataceae bacterium]|nr:exodeoxyribonuclease V subunit alpha [Candidatus Binataceae bacterium]
MSSLYEKLGLRTTRDTAPLSRYRFQRQLRELESCVSVVNLSSQSVHLAAEIAAFASDLDDDRRIALIVLVLVSLAALEEGSTRFPVTGPESVLPMRRLLGPLCGEAFGSGGPERVRYTIEDILTSRAAADVVGMDSSDYKPLLYLSPFIYQHRILSAEILLARRLTTLIESPRDRVESNDIEQLLSAMSTHSLDPASNYYLSGEQRRAVECAATTPLTIISGGPGTGKTTIINAILEVLGARGVAPDEIALTAPTGKAANRIAESIRANAARNAAGKILAEPSTLHRLLEYSPTLRRFRRGRNNPLSARAVIVDEGSMLDLELMSHLLEALRPDARLIILGDADQLPSVSAGAVFRDLMVPESGSDNHLIGWKSVRLTRNYRTAPRDPESSPIARMAQAINVGELAGFASHPQIQDTPVHRMSAAELQFVGAEWLDQAAPGSAFLERWYSNHVHTGNALLDRIFQVTRHGFAPDECESIRRIFAEVAQARILCATRGFEFGADRINAILHERRAHDEAGRRALFFTGEPVMILHNDYSRMLFNGDQGVILRVQQQDAEAAPAAVFPRGDNFIAFGIDALKAHLELCYAMTVHKAQGSEFDAVAIMMPDRDLPIVTRELLYTAVSRARTSVTIVGLQQTITSCIARRIERYCGLRDRLAELVAKS